MQDQRVIRTGWGIRSRLLLVFLVLSTVAALTTAAIAIDAIRSSGREAQQISQEALRDQAESYLIQLTQQGAREIDLTLGEIAGQVETVAGYAGAALDRSPGAEAFWPAAEHMFLGSDGQYMNGPEDVSSVFVPNTRALTTSVLNDVEATAYLDLLIPDVLAGNPSTVAVYLGTPRDVVRYYPNIELGAVVPPDFAVTGRPWYTGALDNSRPDQPVWWTEPYLDATGRGLVTTAAVTVRGARGQLVGVVGFDITLNDLRTSVEATHYLQSGYPFIIDQTGRAVALPSQGYQDILGRSPAPDEVGPDLAGSPTGFATILERMAAGESGFETLLVGDRELFVAFTPLESTAWSLGSVVEASQVMAPAARLEAQVEQATQTLLFSRLLPATLAITAAVLLVGLLLTALIVRPIRQVVDAATRLGQGQLDIQVPVRSRDELGALASAFNTMAAQLRGLVTGLEQRVAERTRDLERQTLQLQTAAEIARMAGESLDPPEMMSRAVELIQDRFQFYHASMFLMDETGTWALLSASTGEAGRQLLARRHRLSVGSASIVGWVTANRLPRVANDVAQDPFYFRNPLLPDTRAEMAMPVMAGQRLIGALDVQSKTPYAFQEADIRAVEAIAAELATAFESTRVLRETQIRLEDVEDLARARWRESWSRAVAGETETAVRLGEGPVGEGQAATDNAAREAAAQGKTVVLEDGRLAATPVLVRGETVATIAARKPNPGERWSEEETALMEAVASQAALALESARQYSEERRRVVELEVVNRISQAVSQLSNLDTLYRVIHNQVNQVIGRTDFLMAVYDPDRDEVALPYVSEHGEVRSEEPVALADDLLSVVIRSRAPLLIERDMQQAAQSLGAKLTDRPPKSWLGVPMLVGESVVGAVAVQDLQTEGRYSEDDAALLATVASQVGTALQNARLLEQVRRTARRQQLIHDITAKIRRSADIETVLATAARELSRGLTASRVVARLGKSADAAQAGPDSGPAGGGGAAPRPKAEEADA